jgi:hypothetical protein
MKQFYLLFCFLLTLTSGIAQTVAYDYDNAGNRISRKIVPLTTAQAAKKNPETPVPVTEQLGERKITVYPNPTQGALAVEITGGDAKDEIHLTLFGPQGTQLQNINATATITPVNLSSYPAGWYVLRIQAGMKETEFKIVKQ